MARSEADLGIVIGAEIADEQTSLKLLDRELATLLKGGVHAQRVAQIARIEQEEA